MSKKLLSWAVNALCVLAILFSLLCAWTVLATPRGHVPALFGHSMLTVLTGSMAPALPEGSLIFVRQTDPALIQPGDVITFYTTIGGYDGVVNTHRVVAVTQENGQAQFRTRGDANSLEDPTPVAADQLVGKVIGSSAVLGGVIFFLQRPYVFIPLVLIPLLILILRSALRLWRLAREEFRRAEEDVRKEYHDKQDDSDTHP